MPTPLDREFWNARVEAVGHTGWADPDVYRYDQVVRLRAVAQVLKDARVQVSRGARVLDVGCGTGDFARAYAASGADVLAIDLSERVVTEARRLTSQKNVTFTVAAAEELVLEPASLDLVSSVTVLQHLSDTQLDTTLARLATAVKPGGHALVLEIAPLERPHNGRAPHVHVRSRTEWIAEFSRHGFSLRSETQYPQLAIIVLNWLARLRSGPSVHTGSGPSVRRRWRRSLGRAILAACWISDHVLALPPPRPLALYRIFLFQRVA